MHYNRLFFCPISEEATEATYILSHEMGWPLGLVASVNQLPIEGEGYTGYGTESFAQHCETLRLMYPRAQVSWCRDHLGKGHEKVSRFIESDAEHGVSCVHLHTIDGVWARKILETWPLVSFEVGPGEGKATFSEIDVLYTHLKDLENFKWLSFPTGCLIKSLGNDCRLDAVMLDWSKRWSTVLRRGHNSDYATHDVLRTLRHYVQGINIAPQLGVIQSCVYLTFARMYGIILTPWEKVCWEDGRNRERWARDWNVIQAVGHYHLGYVDSDLRAAARPMVIDTLIQTMRYYYESFTRG